MLCLSWSISCNLSNFGLRLHGKFESAQAGVCACACAHACACACACVRACVRTGQGPGLKITTNSSPTAGRTGIGVPLALMHLTISRNGGRLVPDSTDSDDSVTCRPPLDIMLDWVRVRPISLTTLSQPYALLDPWINRQNQDMHPNDAVTCCPADQWHRELMPHNL